MITKSPLLWLQNTNTDVWLMVMIELVKCRKKKVNDEFYLKWEQFEVASNCWYDHMRWTNSRNYIKFITNHKYYICPQELIDYEFIRKLYVYGFELKIIEPEQNPNFYAGIQSDLIYFISDGYYNLNSTIHHLMRINNSKKEILNTYTNDFFKFMCLQEERNNKVVYCDIEKRYIKEFRIGLLK